MPKIIYNKTKPFEWRGAAFGNITPIDYELLQKGEPVEVSETVAIWAVASGAFDIDTGVNVEGSGENENNIE